MKCLWCRFWQKRPWPPGPSHFCRAWLDSPPKIDGGYRASGCERNELEWWKLGRWIIHILRWMEGEYPIPDEEQERNYFSNKLDLDVCVKNSGERGEALKALWKSGADPYAKT